MTTSEQNEMPDDIFAADYTNLLIQSLSEEHDENKDEEHDDEDHDDEEHDEEYDAEQQDTPRTKHPRK